MEVKTEKKMNIDTVMLVIVLFLIGLGASILLSATFVMAEFEKHDPYFYFSEQLTHLSVGLLVGVLLFLVPYWIWIRFAWVWGLIATLVLAAMLIPGVAREVKGTTRWLAIIPFQPAEAAKLAVVIVLARYFSHYNILINKIGYGLLGPLAVMGVFGFLIVAERDLGGAVVIGIIVVLMMIVGGVRLFHLLLLSPLALVVYKLISIFEYRSQRMTAWDDPWIDPADSGFNIIHSFYAFACGGMNGVGVGQSQQKMNFLPESHTDYIFSILGEELGLIGVVAVSFLFLAFAGRGFMTARSAKTLSGFYLAIGMTLCIVVPAFINMCVALSIIPAKGLPLPFFSYGGSSIVVSCAAVGIIMGVYNQSLQSEVSWYKKIGQRDNFKNVHVGKRPLAGTVGA
jgi:cell division protein FtsW